MKIIHAMYVPLFMIQFVLKCHMLQMIFFFFFFFLGMNPAAETYKHNFHLQSIFSILRLLYFLWIDRVSVLVEENYSKELHRFFFSISLSSAVLIAAELLRGKNNSQLKNGVYISPFSQYTCCQQGYWCTVSFDYTFQGYRASLAGAW